MMTCSLDGSLREWNLETGEQIGNAWRDGESRLWAAALSPHGKKIVSGGADGIVTSTKAQDSFMSKYGNLPILW